MLEHPNLEIIQQEQHIQAGRQEFAPDKQDLQLEFRRERSSSYMDYKKGANTKLDTAELGSTSFKNKNEYQKKRNAAIRRAQSLTKNATAYTLEVHDQLKQLDSRLGEGFPENDRIFAILENTEFKPQMMYSNNIRLHLTEYVTLVRYYRQLPNAADIEDDELRARKQAIDKIMKPFSKRVEAFCLSNKIELDGNVKARNRHAPKMTEADYEGFFNSTIDAINEREHKYDPDECHMGLEEVENALNLAEVPEDVQVESPAEYDTIEKRVSSLQVIYNHYRKLKDETTSALTIYNEESKKAPKERYRELSRQTFAYQALFVTAYNEAKYLEAREKGAENAPQLKVRAQKSYNDLKAIFDRQMRAEIGRSSSTYGVSHSIQKLTRTDAMQADSVRKSQSSRIAMHNLNADLERTRILTKRQQGLSRATKKQLSDLKKVTDAVRNYYKTTRETEGYTKETKAIKEVLKTIRSFSRKYPNPDVSIAEKLGKLKDYFKGMTNGTLDTSNIPENARRINCVGRRPVNSGDKTDGWKRNAMLETLSYWSDESSTPLFAHEPTVNDLKQRTISNCYMIAAVSGLIEISPEYLKSCIRDNGNGTVTVRLYDKKQQMPDMSRMEEIKNKDYSKENAPETPQERYNFILNSLQKVRDILHKLPEDKVVKIGDDDDYVDDDGIKFDYKGLTPAAFFRLDNLLGSVVRCHDIELAKKNIERIGEFCPLIKKLTTGEDKSLFDDKAALDNMLYEDLRNMASSTGDALKIDTYLGNTKRERELDLSDMEEVYVTMDKEIPKIAGTGMVSEGGLYMQMIEKACAFIGRETDKHEHATGYRSLWYGKQFLSRLTGVSAVFEEVTDELFEKILHARNNKTVYTCGTTKNTKGMDTGHAYTIIGAREENGVRIVKLRNPYSKGSSSYDYGKDEDKFSHKNKIKFFGSSDDSYGTFEMTWERFCSSFSQVTVDDLSTVI